jgi:chemotaxis signal transduction protein
MSAVDVTGDLGDRVRRLEAELGALRRALEPARALPTRPFDALEVWIGDAPWLVPIAAVREVLPRMALAPIPDSPRWVAGGFSYAGRTVAVVDLADRLYQRASPVRTDAFVVFVEKPAWGGLLVDGVGRVIPIDPVALTAPPSGIAVSTLLLATVTLDGQPTSLLSLDHVAFAEAERG